MSYNNCDQILNFMAKDTNNIYAKLRNNLGSQIKLFQEDNLCLRNSLQVRNFESKDQKCQGCHLVSKMTKNDIFEQNIKLNYGKYKNKSFSFSPYTIFNKKIILSNKVKKISNKLTLLMSKYYKSEYYSIKNIYYYHSYSKGLNLAIISIILYKILEKKKLIKTPCFLWSYVCKNNINIMYLNQEYTTLESLSENPLFTDNVSPMACKKNKNNLSQDIMHSIIYQILYILKTLGSFYFTHNEPCIKYLNFTSEVTELNDNFISPVKVIIKPSVYSSISLYNQEKDLWGRYHYNDKEPIKNLFFPVESFAVFYNGTRSFTKCSKNIPQHTNYNNYRIMFYKIGYFSGQFLNARINYGVPLCLKSFDVVCFMCSLYLEKSFRNYIKNSTWWRGLWKKDEYIKLIRDLDNLKKNDFDYIYKVIKNYYIRIDALDFLLFNNSKVLV